jgi:O-antigen/teichoic acid export membrane protein
MEETPPPATAPQEPQRAAGGSLALLTSFGLISVVNYGFAIAMSYVLSVEQYGVLGVVQAVLLVGATVTAAGFPWALAHLLARVTDRVGQSTAFRSALLGNTVLGVAVAAAIVVTGAVGIFNPSAIYAPVMVAAGLTIATLAVNAVLAGTLQGLLRLRELALIRTLEVVIKAVVGFALVALGQEAFGATVGFLVGAVAATALAVVILRGFPFRASARWLDQQIYRSTGPIFVGMFGVAVMSQADILTLKLFSPAAGSEYLAGQYQVAVTFARLPYFAATALLAAVFPYLVRTASSADTASAYARVALKYVFLFLIPFAAVCIVIPDPLIRLFFSPKYDQSAESLRVAAAAMAALTIAYAGVILLHAQGRVGRPAMVLTVAVVLQVIVAAVLVPRSGGVGAAIALGVAALATLVAVLVPVLRGYSLAPAPGDVVRYALALAALAVALSVLPHDSRVTTVISLVLAAVVYVAAIIVLRLLTPTDLTTMAGAFGTRRARVLGLLRGPRT